MHALTGARADMNNSDEKMNIRGTSSTAVISIEFPSTQPGPLIEADAMVYLMSGLSFKSRRSIPYFVECCLLCWTYEARRSTPRETYARTTTNPLKSLSKHSFNSFIYP